MDFNVDWFELFKWFIFLTQWVLILSVLAVLRKHLTFPENIEENQRYDYMIGHLLPTWGAVLSGCFLSYHALTYPHSKFTPLIDMLSVKSDPWSCLWIGMLASVLLIVIEYINSPLFLAVSTGLLTLIMLPGLALPLDSEAVLIASAGKCIALTLAFAILAELKKHRVRLLQRYNIFRGSR